MHEKGVVDRNTVLDNEGVNAEELFAIIKKLQKECIGTSEETFNNVVANKIKERCADCDTINKKFITEAFQLIHDEIY